MLKGFETNQKIQLYCDKASAHDQSTKKRIINIRAKNIKRKKNPSQIVEPRFFRSKELERDEEPYDRKNEAMKGFTARLKLQGNYSRVDMDEARQRCVLKLYIK